jgi:cytochrome c oxidase cbb3-type subunit 3
MDSIAAGRTGVMPPHRDFLGEDKAHLLAAYVYSLSTGQEELEE